jgi:DNA helicase-2/ATP-dependent DNA helicase PcrA
MGLKEAVEAYKEEILDKVYKEYFKPSKGEIRDLEEQIKQMFYKIDCFAILNKFLHNKYKENDPLEYYDAVYLAYIILKVRNIKDFNIYNHLIIDEIQDYNGIELSIINKLFDCKKTMVGDINQKLYSDFTSQFNDCNKLELLNSYRCSKEIFDFINNLIPSNKTISVMRNGNKPLIYKEKDFNGELNKVLALINSSEGTIAVICKNSKESNKLYKSLKEKIEVKRVNDKNKCNVLVCTIYECKGLEFDNVIVVDVDSNNYKYNIEKNWLYIACSRAMHNLNLLYCNNISSFIADINKDLYVEK